MKRTLLRLVLFATAISWGVSICGVFLPWTWAEDVLRAFGMHTFQHDPMVEYWIRMTSGAFAGIGFFYGALGWNPEKYASLIGAAGMFLLLEGMILLIHGWSLHLGPWPFFADTMACFLGGAMMLLFRPPATGKTAPPHPAGSSQERV